MTIKTFYHATLAATTAAQEAFLKTFEKASNGTLTHWTPPAPEKIVQKQAYYTAQAQKITDFFVEEGFEIAGVLFEYLQELKAGRMRKNEYEPDISHEIDQMIPPMTSLQYGPLKEKRARVEAAYGSVEKWFCSILAHDIGEDFNIFPAELKAELFKRLQEKNITLTEEHQACVDRVARSMERLTHYRKFTLDDFKTRTGASLSHADLKNLKKGTIIPLNAQRDFFWEKMNVLAQGRDNLQLYAKWDTKKDRPLVILTSHGKTREDAPEELQKYGPDWNLYLQSIIMEDIYDALTKIGDRVQGMASRIAIKDFTAKSYDKYLNETRHLFADLDAANLLREYLYCDSPLEEEIISIDCMMEALHTIGKVYIYQHPDLNPNGERGQNAQNTDSITRKISISPIKISHCFPALHDFYGYFDESQTQSHPISMIMEQLRDVVPPRYYEAEHEKMLALITDALIEQNDKGYYVITGEDYLAFSHLSRA